MKQNAKRKSFIIVVAMLVLLATVLGMSGMTFAKYTSMKTLPTQSATVAQWGWVINIDAANLFGDNYGDVVDADKNLVTINTTGNATAVKAYADTDYNVVAPGTTGYVYFNILGSAEVLSSITITATGTDVYLTDNATDDPATDGVVEGPKTYNPIKWTLYKSLDPSSNTNPYEAVENAENLTLDEMIEFLNDMSVDSINAGTENHDIVGYYRLTWEWAFDNTTANVVGTLNGNEADTLLGSYEAGTVQLPENWTASTDVTFGLTIEVSQIQPE